MVDDVMSRIGKLFIFGSLVALLAPLRAETSDEPVVLKERPRVFLGPYNDRALNRYYYGFSGSAYGSYFYSPLAYFGPSVPGRSSVSFSVGSDGYRGASFSTTQPIEGTNVLFSIHSHWEEGELWYLPGYRYSQSVISPRLSWSNQNTSISVGVDIIDSKFTQKERTRMNQPRIQRINRSPLATDLRGDIYEMDFESVNVTLSQRLGNIGELYLSASKDDFENDSFSAGIHRRIYEGRNGSGEWLPPLR